MKKGLSLILMSAGFVFMILFGSFGVTGNSIAVLSSISKFYPLTDLLGLVLVLGSFLLLAYKRSLDAIIIPTGKEDVLRAEVAGKNADKLKEGGYFLISGVKDTKKHKDSHRYKMFYELKGKGISPRQIKLEGRSINTEENLLNSLNRIKKLYERNGDREGSPINIGIVSYPRQLNRFWDIYEQAIKEGIIEEGDFKLYKIRTKESLYNKLYESNPLERYIHGYQLRTMGERHKGRGRKSKYPSAIRFLEHVKRGR